MPTESDAERFLYGSPSLEYCKIKGYNKTSDIHREKEASIHDLLTAVLISADVLFEELRRMRVIAENSR